MGVGTAAAVTLRPVRPGDADFLFRLYASTRETELAPVTWSAEEKRTFLLQQFSAQTSEWEKTYANPDFRIVEVDDAPAGRFYVNRSSREIRLVDIALLPNYRGSGIGTELLVDLLAEARLSGLPVTLHVEMFNPILPFYERLGFRKVEDHGAYFFLKWEPEGAQGAIS